MNTPTESIVRDTVERTTADLRAENDLLRAQLADALLAVEGFLADRDERAEAHEQELDRVITAAAEGATEVIRIVVEAAVAAERLGIEEALVAHALSGRGGIDYSRGAAMAAEIVRARGKVVLP